MVHHRFFAGENPDTLIFLNGMPSDFSVWGALALHFKKKGFSVLLHNYRGQRNSPPLQDGQDMKTQLQDLLQLMDHYKIRQAHLVGASYGGQLALRAVLDHKGPWLSLTLLSTYAVLDREIQERFHHWQELLQQGSEHYIRSLAPSFYSEQYLQRNPSILDQLTEQVRWHGFVAGQQAMLQILSASDPAELPLEDIHLPTQAVWGAEDRLTPAHHSRILKERIPHCHTQVIPQASHALTMEAYRTLVELLEQHCRH